MSRSRWLLAFKSIVFFSIFFHPVFVWGQESQAIDNYCNHAKKLINIQLSDPTGERLLNSVQRELNRYNSSEYSYNGRYELCFDLRYRNEAKILLLGINQKLTLTNTSNKEVVIGFLKAQRTDDSSTPLLEIRGNNVTVFASQMSNLKKAIVFVSGSGHKIVGGTIAGKANAQDSLCVSGNANNVTIKDAVINDCANAIQLTGNNNTIESSHIAFTAASHNDWPARGDNSHLWFEQIEQGRANHVSGTCLSLSGQNGILRGVVVKECDGVGLKLAGSTYSITNSQFIGEPIPDDIYDLPERSGLARHSTKCLFLDTATNVTLESNTFTQCEKGIHIVGGTQINIGPANINDFATKKNQIHHNDYAIHAQNSQQVFARHNQVYEISA